MRRLVRASHTTAAVLCTCLAFSGCTTGSAAPSVTTPTDRFQNALADVQHPMSELEQGAIEIQVGGAPHAPDWQADGFGSVWVSNEPKSLVQRIDPTTDRVVGSVHVTTPCAGMGSGYGSIWVPDCKDGAIVRIEPSTEKITAVIRTPIASDEGLIGVGAGGVWFLRSSSSLAMIDPSTNEISRHVAVTSGSQAAIIGAGSVWVSSPPGSSVDRVDPTAGKVVETIDVGPSPLFMASGMGGVWVLNRSDGTVSRIDAATDRVTATIDAQSVGDGGCIAAGLGSVWVTIPGFPLTRIDPSTDEVTDQFVGQGGDCLSVAYGSVWLSNHELGNVWRIQP